MGSSVLAAVAVKPGVTELRELPRPPIDAVSGLLQVEITGVCGSDWGFYNQFVAARGPLVIGHETVGTIAEAGADALRAWGLKIGDRVVLEEYVPCGHCEFCRGGEFRHCKETEWRNGGLRYGATELTRAPGLWGGYAQFQYLHPNTVFHRIPEGLEGRYAALALPVANGIEWTILQGGAGPGDTVVIQGPGQQGLACVAAAKLVGAKRIIVTGLSTPVDRARLAFALKLGADHAIEIGSEDLLETVAEITGGRMADLAIDCTGAEAAVLSTFQLARKTGRVVLGGHLGKPLDGFNMNQIVNKFLTVRGMKGHSYRSVELALDMIARNQGDVRALSTRVFPLGETDSAIRAQAAQGSEPVTHCCVNPWA